VIRFPLFSLSSFSYSPLLSFPLSFPSPTLSNPLSLSLSLSELLRQPLRVLPRSLPVRPGRHRPRHILPGGTERKTSTRIASVPSHSKALNGAFQIVGRAIKNMLAFIKAPLRHLLLSSLFCPSLIYRSTHRYSPQK